jgi:hypothetical protein
MNKKEKAIFGIFRSDQEIKTTVDDLVKEGFQKNDISVLTPTTEKPNINHRTIVVVAAGILGAILSVTFLIVSDFNLPLGKGRIAGAIALTLLGLLGAMIGVLVARALVGYGPADEPIIKYTEVLQKGDHLLSINLKGGSETAYRALQILKDHHARNISLQNNTLKKSKWKTENFT